MIRNRIFWLVCIFWLLPISSAVFADGSPDTAVANVVERVDRLLQHADTCYWLGIEERGDVRIFRRGLGYLQNAQTLVKSIEDSDLKNRYTDLIHGAQNDLEEQLEMARNTLYGVFPLLRFMMFDVANYEIVEDPNIMATTRATSALVKNIRDHWKFPQLDVVCNSHVFHDGQYNILNGSKGTNAPNLQNKMAYIFNRSPEFFNHNEKAVRSVLSLSEAAAFYRTGLTAETADKLCNGLGIKRILQVSVKEIDVVGHDWFYAVEARLFEKSKGMSHNRLVVFGFTRDVRNRVHYIIGSLGALLFLPFLMTTFIGGTTSHKVPIALSGLILGIAGTAGACVVAARWQPEVEQMAVYTFWGALIMALAVYAVPLTLASGFHSFLVSRIRVYDWNRRSLQRLYFTAVACGASFLPAWAIFSYYEPREAIVIMLAWFLPAVTAAHFLAEARVGAMRSINPGRMLMVIIALLLIISSCIALVVTPKQDLLPLVIVKLIFPLLLGVGLFLAIAFKPQRVTTGKTWAFWGAALFALAGPFAGMTDVIHLHVALIFLGIAALSCLFKVTVEKSSPIQHEPLEVEENVANWLENPNTQTGFVSYGQYESTHNDLSAAVRRRASMLLRITGPSGSGKTRTANELIKSIKSDFKEPIVLGAICRQERDVKPYGPFRDLLAGFCDDSSADLCSLVNEMTSAFVSVFLPSLTGPVRSYSHDSSSLSPSAAAVQFVDAIKNIKSKSPSDLVIVILDDVQCMDSASREMLLSIGASNSLKASGIIIIACECSFDDSVDNAWSGWCNWTLDDVPSPQEFLMNACAMEPDTSGLFSRLLDDQTGITPLNLLDIVRNNMDKLACVNGRLRLRRDICEDKLLIPASISLLIRQRIEILPHDVIILLQLATCFGRRFDVSEVADIEGINATMMLARLEIAENAGIVRDVRDADDIWEFTSGIYHRYLLETLTHPDDNCTPRQRQAGYHKKITDMFARRVREAEQKKQGVRDSDLTTLIEHALKSGSKYNHYIHEFAVSAVKAYLRGNNYGEALDLVRKLLTLSDRQGSTDALFESRLLALAADLVIVVQPNADVWESLIRRSNAWIQRNMLDEYSDPEALSDFVMITCKTVLSQLEFAKKQRERAKDLLKDVNIKLKPLESIFARLSVLQQIEVLRMKIFFMRRSGEYDAAKAIADKAVFLSEQLLSEGEYKPESLISEAAKAYNDRAEITMWLPDKSMRRSAKKDFSKSIELKELINDKVGLARSWGGLGRLNLYADVRDFDRDGALLAFQKDLKVSEEISDIKGIVSMPCFIGHVYLRSFLLKQGGGALLVEARQNYEQCLAKASKFDDQFNAAVALCGLTICDMVSGEIPLPKESITLDPSAIAIIRDIPELTDYADQLSDIIDFTS